jgi:hypothetical protein
MQLGADPGFETAVHRVVSMALSFRFNDTAICRTAQRPPFGDKIFWVLSRCWDRGIFHERHCAPEIGRVFPARHKTSRRRHCTNARWHSKSAADNAPRIRGSGLVKNCAHVQNLWTQQLRHNSVMLEGARTVQSAPEGFRLLISFRCQIETQLQSVSRRMPRQIIDEDDRTQTAYDASREVY